MRRSTFTCVVVVPFLVAQNAVGLGQGDAPAGSPSENQLLLPPSPTEAPSLNNQSIADPEDIRGRDYWEVCGVDSGGRALVTCSAGAYCATLSHKIRPDGRVGCCSADGCDISYNCVEGEATSSAMQLVCTGESSFCATYTWIDENAKSYACATARTTLSVSDGTGPVSSTVFFTSLRPTPDDNGGVTLSAVPTTGTPKITHPTTGSGNDPGDKGGGGPAIGSEADLQTRQRIGAGVGAGVFGSLLFGFFMIFGCIRRPGERRVSEKQAARESQQLLVDMQRGAPRSPSDFARYDTENSSRYTPTIDTAYSGVEMSPQSAYHADSRSYHGFDPLPRSANDADFRYNSGFETVPTDPLNVGWR